MVVKFTMLQSNNVNYANKLTKWLKEFAIKVLKLYFQDLLLIHMKFTQDVLSKVLMENA